MENKQNYFRSMNAKACQPSEANRKSSDLQLNKARRRDQSTTPRNEQTGGSKHTHNNSQKKPQNRFNADKRPRPRGGAGRNYDTVPYESDDFAPTGSGLAIGKASADLMHGPFEYELNSVQLPGSKKHSLNHLLNFHYSPRDMDYAMHGMSFFGRNSHVGNASNNQRNNCGRIKQHKYNKEQFLRANFQFVIRSPAKPKFETSPDVLIDWHLIEQINIQTTEEPQCPICLYPPIAAKITRCGHVYCWPCLLHYLALTDKSWRKCPICYEAIHASDLKSCIVLQQQTINVGDEITFRLMRRRKGSLYIEPYACPLPSIERYPQMSKNDIMQRFSKFLIAKRADVHEIVERERKELINCAENDGMACPEYIFIHKAMTLLQERLQKLIPADALTTASAVLKEHEDETEGVPQVVENATKSELRLTAEKENTVYQSEQQTATYINDDMNEAAAGADVNQTTVGSQSSAELTEFVTTAAECPSDATNANSSTKYHFFYQCEDGQNNYLHPLNIKMLQATYDTLDRAPLVITAKILQREQFSMDEENRRKLTCLSHLPLTCQLSFVEVDLQPPIVSTHVLKVFKDDIMFRKKERQRRERAECKREKHINELNDRQMGKLIDNTANINISSPQEFPTCGFDELPPPVDSCGGSSSVADAIPIRKHAFSYSTITKVEEAWPTARGPSFKSNSMHAGAGGGGGALQQARSTNQVVAAESIADGFDMRVCLGDVLAEALSQKQTKKTNQKDEHNNNSNNANVGNHGAKKKSKRAKKVLPIFATGMNYKSNN